MPAGTALRNTVMLRGVTLPEIAATQKISRPSASAADAPSSANGSSKSIAVLAAVTLPSKPDCGREAVKETHRRHLVLPHREAVTFGQKTPTKSKVIFDPLACNFQRPVIDLLQRGDELLKLVIGIETRRHPPRYRRPPLNGDDAVIEMDADGFPIMPAFLRRTSCPANVEPAAIECATPNPNLKV